MKKLIPLVLLITIILTTGCIKRDTMEDITIYTSAYPIEYITNKLYGEHSKIKSIYPNGVIIDNYEFTDIQIKDFSKGDLFIFNGLSKEKDYITPMIKYKSDLKIIDTTFTMDYEYGSEELWLNPSNVLMMAQNIRKGFEEYISNQYLKNNINENYEDLKIAISNIEAKMYLLAENSTYKTLVVSNDALKFLSKYGFDVYSVENTDNFTDKTKEIVKSKINSGDVKFIFGLSNEENNDFIKSLTDTDKVSTVYLHSLSNLSEKEVSNNEDYITIMNSNIDLLRGELYKD